jgi:hypothetical protein
VVSLELELGNAILWIDPLLAGGAGADWATFLDQPQPCRHFP